LSVTATCPAGEVATGGGYSSTGWTSAMAVIVYEDAPLNNNAWTAAAMQTGSGTNNWTLNTYVICSK
jgi:hypothetical protein